MSTQVHRLEEELNDAKSNLSQKESDLENTQNRLRTIEELYSSLQLEANKTKMELDAVIRLEPNVIELENFRL